MTDSGLKAPHSSLPTGPSRSRYLLAAATAMELEPLRQALVEQGGGNKDFDFLLCGVGPTATAATLAAYLACRPGVYAGVIISGVAGAYPAPAFAGRSPDAGSSGLVTDHRDQPETSGHGMTSAPGPGLLDICLADREVLGDFGLAAPHGAVPFANPELAADREFSLATPLLQAARDLLQRWQIPFHCGAFVTVNAATTTTERGLALARDNRALCENMEGAAAALVCRRLELPLLEIRCVSNLVEDRDPSRWRLAAAIKRNAEVLARLLPALAADKRFGPFTGSLPGAPP